MLLFVPLTEIYNESGLGTYQHGFGDVENLPSDTFRLFIELYTTDKHGVRMSPRFFRFVTVIKMFSCYLFRYICERISNDLSLENECIALFYAMAMGHEN